MDILIYLIFFGAGMSLIADNQSVDYEFVRDPPVEAAPVEAAPEIVPEAPAEPGDEVAAAPRPTLPSFGVPQPPAVAPIAEPPATDPSAGTGPVAEDQTPTGKMTTAAEVKPILSVTKPQWVAVREFDGKDLLYFTNLLAWRCGVLEIRYSVNGGPLTLFDAEPCHMDEATPNALKGDSIYIELPLQSLQSLHVEVLYDDLSADAADYDRAAIQIN